MPLEQRPIDYWRKALRLFHEIMQLVQFIAVSRRSCATADYISDSVHIAIILAGGMFDEAIQADPVRSGCW